MLDEATTIRIYQQQRRLLLSCAARILGDRAQAEDVVHDAWIAATKRTNQETIRDFGSYLYLTVRNMAIDSLRRAERQNAIAGGNFEAAINVADPAPDTDARISAEQELGRFHEALAQLPERQRIAVEMHRMSGFTLREIAERLGTSTAYAHRLVVQGLGHCAHYIQEGR